MSANTHKTDARRAAAAKYLTPELKERMRKAIEEESRPEVIAANKAQARELLAQKRAAEAVVTVLMKSIQEEKERQQLSLADLAARSGIDRSNLSRMLSEASGNPTIQTLHRLAAAVGKRLIVSLSEK